MAGISSESLNGARDNKRGFNGNEIQSKEFSDLSGIDFYDFNARMYDQQLGRFLQIDPLFEDEQESLNPYHFSYNNPFRYSDPDGKTPGGCCDFGDMWSDVKDGIRQIALSTTGALNAWSSNQILGAGRTDPSKMSGLTESDKKAVATGQAVGDAISIFTGVVELVGSGTAELVTFGAASPVAIPLALHGGSTALMGVKNLSQSVERANMQGSGQGRGKNSRKPDPEATGDHTVSDNRGATTYKTNDKNPSGFDEVKRVDTKGRDHKGVPTPHVVERGKPVRPATIDEIPKSDLKKNKQQ
jgi:RHS repeat-associated protein